MFLSCLLAMPVGGVSFAAPPHEPTAEPFEHDVRSVTVFRAPYEVRVGTEECGDPRETLLHVNLEAMGIEPRSLFSGGGGQDCQVTIRRGSNVYSNPVPCPGTSPNITRLVDLSDPANWFDIKAQVDICLSLWDYRILSTEGTIKGQIKGQPVDATFGEFGIVTTFFEPRSEWRPNGSRLPGPILRLFVDCAELPPLGESSDAAFLSLVADFALEERDLEACTEEECYGTLYTSAPRTFYRAYNYLEEIGRCHRRARGR